MFTLEVEHAGGQPAKPACAHLHAHQWSEDKEQAGVDVCLQRQVKALSLSLTLPYFQ